MDTSSWRRATLGLQNEIRLDSKNVRLEKADAKVEADIIEDLFANEDALGLVEGICAVGYLTHETPIVVVRDGQNTVVEGNRRIAALKAMQNPMLVPDFSNRISALVGRYPDHPVVTDVEVLVAPSQDEADELIAAIHTGNLRRAWSPSRQAQFFQAQIDAGKKYEDLVKRYPISDVKKFVFRAHVVNRFKLAKYDDPELRDFVASKSFKKGLSTLTRIYEAKEFKDLTGLKMEDDGSFSMAVSDEVFDKIAARIIADMNEGSLNTRTLNKVIGNPRFDQLMAEIKVAAGTDAKPVTKPTQAEVPAGPQPKAKEPSGGATTSTPARVSKDKYLMVSRVTIPPTYGEGFKQTLEELSVTDVTKFPATTFLLMRAALEKGIKSFAEARNEDIRKSMKVRGYVFLSHCMEWLARYASQQGERSIAQVVSNMNKVVYYTVSQDKLNAVNHNHRFVVTSEEAVEMWKSVVAVLEYVAKP